MIEKKEVEAPERCDPWTGVSVWCYNCSDAIAIYVEVPATFEPHPDVGTYNIMDPLTRHLKEIE